jgi:D-glycerate 3-kinase
MVFIKHENMPLQGSSIETSHPKLEFFMLSNLLEQALADPNDRDLYDLLLQQIQQDQLAGKTIAPINARWTMRVRFHLLQTIYPHFQTLQRNLQLESNLLEPLWNIWLPLGLQIVTWRMHKQTPCTISFLGGQGTGKTTLTEILKLILKALNYTAIAWSLDDLYLPYRDRLQLQAQDARIDRRGPPGTHDVALGLQVLDQFHRSQFPLELPRFDKSLHHGAGDRIQPDVIEKADILLFEGWCVGVRPIDPSQFAQAPDPIVTAADRTFAEDMNAALANYVPLWDKLDRLVILHVPDYRMSIPWRQEAEHKMIAQGKPGMSDAEIRSFVEYFWKALHPQLFIQPLTQNSPWVDGVITIQPNHLPSHFRLR